MIENFIGVLIIFFVVILTMIVGIVQNRSEYHADSLRGFIDAITGLLSQTLDEVKKRDFVFSDVLNKSEQTIQSLTAQNKLLREQNDLLCKLMCGYEKDGAVDFSGADKLIYYKDDRRLKKQNNLRADLLKDFRKWTVKDFDTYIKLINQCPKGLRSEKDTDKILRQSDEWKMDFTKLNDNAAAYQLCMLQLDCESCKCYPLCHSELLNELHQAVGGTEDK